MQYLVNVIGSRSNSGTADETVATGALNDKPVISRPEIPDHRTTLS